MREAKPVLRIIREANVGLWKCVLLVVTLFSIQTDRSLQAQVSSSLDEFILRPGNLLQVSIWPDNALGGEFPIEDSGIVYLPLLGPIFVNGLPISEFRNTLREEYGRVMQSPVVSVTPLFEVSVLGAVRQPGLYQLMPTQGVFSAISLAGGFLENAKIDEVRVVGDDGVSYVDAEIALESGEELTGLRLQANDRIIVPEGTTVTTGTVLSIVQSLGIAVALVLQLSGGN